MSHDAQIQFASARTDSHFEQILQLQQRNLARALAPQQQVVEGFVFAEHTLELLQQMAAHLPQVIALADDSVVAYNLAMSNALRTALPSLMPMFDEFERCRYRGSPLPAYRYMVGGQICVDRRFRGQGLSRRLYHETRRRLPPGYQLCVTEVSARNRPSLQAHLRMGFELIASYHDGSEQWHVVAWDLERVAADADGPNAAAD